MAAMQREQTLKYELVVPIASLGRADRRRLVQLPPRPLRPDVRHQDGGRPDAHTACVGFGLERIALALFKAHGFDPRQVAARRPTSARAVTRQDPPDRSPDLRPPSDPRRRPDLGGDELLRRSLDRAAARARPRPRGGAALHDRHRLRGRPVDVLQVSARRPRRTLRPRRPGAGDLAPAGGTRRGAGGPGPPVARGAGFVLLARHRGHGLPDRARQVDRGRQRDRHRGRRISATFTMPTITSCTGRTSTRSCACGDRGSRRGCRRTWSS